MRIADVETVVVSLPLERPVRTPVHHITTVDVVLVTVRTDVGIDGIAYLWAFGVPRARVLEAMVRDLARFVVGRDARERTGLRQTLLRELNFLGRAGVGTFALSAIDTALWDIAAKAVGEPLWRLLGGNADPVPAYAGGLFLSDDIPAIVDEALRYRARGFRAIKMRVGAETADEDVARVAAVREAVGPDIVLMVDVVQGWTVSEAIRRGQALERFDPYYIEDPLPFDDEDGMVAVAAALDTPIAAGENNYGSAEFRRLIEKRAVDIAMIDLQRVGGITEWLAVARLADAWHLPVVPHVFHEISMHFAASLPNVPFIEWIDWWEPLFDSLPLIRDGALVPADRPGLGLSFDRDAVERFRACQSGERP